MAEKTPVEVLREARRLLVDGGWTQGCMARTRDGRQVYVSDKDATCFCASGAIWRTSPNNYGLIDKCESFLEQALPRSFKRTPNSLNFVLYNDSRKTVAPVLRLYDRAIALAES